MNPRVSVLMSVYNGEQYLEEAIESILDQTYHNIEFIIVNDGSTDQTAEILAKYERMDERILVYSQENQGLASALNKGIELSQGKYIARMDADDISRPRRIEIQVSFMEQHDEIGICGTWFETSDRKIVEYPTENETIRSNLIFDSSLAHPTVMIRRSLLVRSQIRYPTYRYAQDFALWAQIACQTTTFFANLPLSLVYIRAHSKRVASLHRTEQMEYAKHARIAQLQWLHIAPSTDEIEIHQAVSEWNFQPTKEFITQCDIWLRNLASSNQQYSIYPEPEFSEVLSKRWFGICSSATTLGFWSFRTFIKSPFRNLKKLCSVQGIKFFFICAKAQLIGT